MQNPLKIEDGAFRDNSKQLSAVTFAKGPS